MDCTSPSMLIGANWAAAALPELSLEAATASLDGAVRHLDHSRDGARNVFKFGGTSVGSPARLQGLVRIVREERARVIAVVVSAMGHTTDHLLEAVDFAAQGDARKALEVVDAIEKLSIDNAHETQRLVAESLRTGQEVEGMEDEVVAFFKPLRELLYGISLLQEKTAAALDTVLSFGERMSATIVAKLLTKAGVKAFFLDAREWLTTDATYGCAVVAFEESKQKLKELSAGWESQGLPVITGFIGRARAELGGRTTTLGRNGSDYTATIVGAALEADYVVINTDISGVMTADPRIVERAVALSHLNHHEALELAVYGTRMFHARTMVPLIKAGVTMLIRNTMDPNGHGTYISSAEHTGKAETCTTSLENLAMLEVRTRILQDASLQVADSSISISENIGARITKVLEAHRIPVWLSIRGAHGQAINVVIPRDSEIIARDAIHEELTVEMESHEVDPLNVQSPVTMLSIVAEDFTSVPYNQTKFFGALADAGISVLAVGQGTSSRSLSCVIRGEDTKVAVRRVHDAFNVDHVDTSVVLLGCNHITHEVIAQLQKQQELYRQQHKTHVKIVGFGSNCSKFEFNSRGFTFEELLSRIEQCKKDATPHNSDAAYAGAPTLEQLDALQDMPIPMLVDCSGQRSPKDLYTACLERGIHVVVSNARSVCDLPPTASRESIAATSRSSGRAFFMYTSTIGASLPVIDTLGNILRTGDRVLRIETGLSGSMGFVTNEIMKGVSLSSAVREALSRGYCERDPREDLAGSDVVAKIVVLARALGVRLQTRAIRVEPLVPREILDAISWSGSETEVETLCEALKAHDDAFRAKFYQQAVAQGKRLRYVASIDLANFPEIEAEVKPALVDESHPAFYAHGNEIAFGFSTHQYQPNPLVLKGSGSGATAGATGVLRDVVTILYTLQGKNLHV